MVNKIISYFDLQSEHREIVAKGNAASAKNTYVLPQYLIVSAGVVIEPFLRIYVQSGTWGIDSSIVFGRIIFGLIMGIILLPPAYKATFDTEKPIFVQLAALLPIGIGWQSLFSALTKITLG